jgi:hypothetical protein
MADEQQSGLDNRQLAMTRKTSKARSTKKAKKAEARSQAVDELDQLEMFQEQEDGFDADGPYDDDLEDEAGEVNFAAVEEALQEAGDVLDGDIDHEPDANGSKRIQKRVRRQRARHEGGLNLLLIAGWLMLIPSGGLLMASLAAPTKMGLLLESLSTAGLTPAALVTISLIVIGTAILRARQANIELRVGEVETTLLDNDTGMSASLDYLVEAQEQHLERQDEKVNNLTKATKMYGKPLIEITKQMAEVSTRVEALRSSLGTMNETMNEAMDLSGLQKTLTDLSQSLQQQVAGELEKILTEVQKQDDDNVTTMLAELKQGISQMSSGIQKLQQSAAAARSVAQAPAGGPAAPAAPAAPSTIGSGSQGSGKSGLAQSISGTKSSAGKDVLGSIAKLKKMRQ